MKSLVSFAALAVIAFAAAAPTKAQDSNSSSTSGSSSNSNSGAASFSSSNGGNNATSGASTTSGNRQRVTSTSGLTLNQNSNVPDTQRVTSTSQGSGSYNNNNTGFTSSDVTVRTTPTVYAPPVSGGNPCTLAVSGGVSVIGWGAAAGGTFVDEDCANRQKIAMIHNAGYAGAARELMCNDKATYYAFRGTNTPCTPRPAFDGPGAPPVVGAPQLPQQMPTVVTPAPMVQSGPMPGPGSLPRCRGPNDQGPCFSG